MARKDVGIDAFLEAGFGEVLEDWQPTEPDPEELERQKAQAKVDAARDALVTAGFRLACAPEGGDWSLRLDGRAEIEDKIGDEVEVTAWPVTLLQAQHERRIADGAGEPVVWSPLSAASLTSLVAFEARVGTGKTAARARFALQLPIVGLPEDRDAHIVRSIVATQSAFLRYLRLLLALAEGTPLGSLVAPCMPIGSGAGCDGGAPSPTARTSTCMPRPGPLKRDKTFLAFEGCFMLYGIGFLALQPVLPIFLVDEIGVSYSEVALARNAIFWTVMVLASPIMGRIGDRLGILRLGALGFGSWRCFRLCSCSHRTMWGSMQATRSTDWRCAW